MTASPLMTSYKRLPTQYLGRIPCPLDIVNHFHNALTGVPASDDILETYGGLLDNDLLSSVEFDRQIAEFELFIKKIDVVGIATPGLEY